MKQAWYCENCDALASCTIPLGADVYTAIERLRRAHSRISPKCEGGINTIRVRAPGCSLLEWKKVRKDAREKRLAALKEKFIVDPAPMSQTQCYKCGAKIPLHFPFTLCAECIALSNLSQADLGKTEGK